MKSIKLIAVIVFWMAFLRPAFATPILPSSGAPNYAKTPLNTDSLSGYNGTVSINATGPNDYINVPYYYQNGQPISLGTLSGVVTGPAGSNVFNSTNTAGNTMNNALIVNNPSGNNAGSSTPPLGGDLEIGVDSGGGAYLGLDVLYSSSVYQQAWLEAFPQGTGAELDINVNNADGSSGVEFQVNSVDATGGDANIAIPGYGVLATPPSINGGLVANQFGFPPNAIYSAAGTAIPIAASINNHMRACVSDSLACTSGTTYASGHSTVCEVWSNGTNWIESGSGC